MVYMYHNFLIHSSVNGHLGCFLAFVNSATMNTGVHVSKFSVHCFDTFLAGERLPFAWSGHSSETGQGSAQPVSDMQTNRPRATLSISGLCTPGGNIPLPQSPQGQVPGIWDHPCTLEPEGINPTGQLQEVPRWLCRKESACSAGDGEFHPWIGKIPWRRAWQPPPVLLPGESHGQRSLAGYSPWGHTESDTTGWLSSSSQLQTASPALPCLGAPRTGCGLGFPFALAVAWQSWGFPTWPRSTCWASCIENPWEPRRSGSLSLSCVPSCSCTWLTVIQKTEQTCSTTL